MIPRQEDVEAILSPFHDVLYDIVKGAWGDWLNSSEFACTESPRTRACIVWEHMISRAKEAFLDVPNIEIVKHHHTYSFLVDDRVLFRFKKGDQAGHSGNYPTQMALAFHDPEQPNLFGIEDEARVQIVYSLDDLQLELERVRVVARINLKIAWDYEIPPGISVIEEVPSLPVTKAEPRQLIRPRTVKEVSESIE